MNCAPSVFSERPEPQPVDLRELQILVGLAANYIESGLPLMAQREHIEPGVIILGGKYEVRRIQE